VFTNPFAEKPKESVNDKATKLANNFIVLIGANVTDSQRDAFVKVMNVILVEHPWILNAPVIKEWLK